MHSVQYNAAKNNLLLLFDYGVLKFWPDILTEALLKIILFHSTPVCSHRTLLQPSEPRGFTTFEYQPYRLYEVWIETHIINPIYLKNIL